MIDAKVSVRFKNRINWGSFLQAHRPIHKQILIISHDSAAALLAKNKRCVISSAKEHIVDW